MYCARCGQEGKWLEHCKSRRGDTEAYFGFNPGELCQGCYRDLVDDPVVFDTDLRNFKFDFFYSASSGTSRAVVENQKEDNVLVSYATHMNGRIGTESKHWVDCGGDPQAFTTDRFVENDGYPTSQEEYLDYVEEVTAGSQDYWVLRDYPCAKSALDKHDATVAEFQRRTAEDHKELLERANDRDIKAQPVSVLQGLCIRDYLRHANILKEFEALTDYVCIGSIVPYGPERQQQIILAIRSFLPERFRIHGLGVNLATLREPGVLDALRSSDTGFWFERGGAKTSPWRWNSETSLNLNKVTKEYLEHRTSLNEILLEHDWDLDQPIKEASKETLSGYTDSESNETPSRTSPEPHLNNETIKALESVSFNGMETSTPRKTKGQKGISEWKQEETESTTKTETTDQSTIAELTSQT